MNKDNVTSCQANGKKCPLKSVGDFFRKPFFSDYRTLAVLWVILTLVAAFTKGGLDGTKLNNFSIYRMVFYHLLDFKSLYLYYPEEYHDHNLYGPFFSLMIAPYAVMPRIVGLIAWLLSLTALMYATILKMPLDKGAKIVIMWVVTNEMMSAMQMAQFNVAIAAFVVCAYISIRKDRVGWSALFVALGTMTKLYGIVALPLILFTKKKWKFAGWFVLWMAVMFVLPMFISSPEYVIGQYREWALTIIDKNDINVAVGFNTASNYYQNISVLGMTHRITQLEFSDLWILGPACLLFLLPFVRFSQYRYHAFQWGVVASALMCIILFSTGSESSGYIIAMLGVAIWFVSAPSQRSGWDLFLLIFAIVIASFGTSDLMPSVIKRGFIRPYSLKALPVLLVWLKLLWEMCTVNYANPYPTRSSQKS